MQNNSMSAAAAEMASSDTDIAPIPLTTSQKILRRTGWFFFGLFCLIFFTLTKLPEDRIKNYIDGTISSALSSKGVSYSSADSHLSFLFGLSYTMKDITLLFPAPTPPAHIDKLEVAPALLPMLIGKLGGKFWLNNGDGSLNGSFSIRKSSIINTSITAKKLDLGKLGVLPLAAGIQGTGMLDGVINLSGDMSSPSTAEGNIDITITRLSLDPQSIQGFSVPKISVGESKIDIVVEKSKATIKTLRVGKQADSTDDLNGSVTGDLTLGKKLDQSTISIKTHFGFSDSIMKAFSLLDALLGAGKQVDGSYAFSLEGPLMSPMPMPIKEGN